MNKILVILTLDMDNIPSNFQEILVHEKVVIEEWKEKGIIEHLFLRPEKNGAVLIFKNTDEAQAKAYMETLPLYALKKSVDYFNLMQQF